VPALRPERASERPAQLAPLKRVGHKGADTVAPGNTLESFEAALAAGVDMIEFDVLRERSGRLVLATSTPRGGPASRSTRGSTTSPARRTAASSSTST
jgi:hypothetical protein